MPRNITPALQLKLDTKRGTEPIIVVQIKWDNGDVFYAGKEFVYDSVEEITTVPQLKTFNPVNNLVRLGDRGTVVRASITIKDDDGSIKEHINNSVIEGTKCIIWQHYIGIDRTDNIPLVEGVITNSPRWREGTRVFSFDVEAVSKDTDVSFKATEKDFTDGPAAIDTVNPDAINKNWPFCFGSPRKVKALHYRKRPRGEIMGTSRNHNLIDNGRFFPQSDVDDLAGTVVDVLKPGPDSGHFVDDIYVPVGVNDSVIAVNLIAREPGDFFANFLHWFIDIDSSTLDLTRHYIYFERWDDRPPVMSYIILEHVGFRIALNRIPRWGPSGEPNIFGKQYIEDPDVWVAEFFPDNIQQAVREVIAVNPRTVWRAQFAFGRESPVTKLISTELGDLFRVTWPDPPKLRGRENLTWEQTSSVGESISLTAAGDAVFRDEYLVNIFQSDLTLDFEVFGKRTINGKENLVPIPTTYYATINKRLLADEDLKQTILSFSIALIDRDVDTPKTDDGWAPEVYVTVPPSITHFDGKGGTLIVETTNAASVIAWLLDTYTSFTTVRDADFTKVLIQVRGAIMNFVIQKDISALKLAEDIAFQARCAILFEGNDAYIRFLATEPDAVITLAEDNTSLKSLELSFVDAADMVTRFIAKWRISRSGLEIADPVDEEQIDSEAVEQAVTIDNNTALFGTRIKTFDYFIYNDELLVETSASWWAYRFGNSWRVFKIDTFMNALPLQIFDVASINIPTVSANALKLYVQEIIYDSSRPNISLKGLIESKAGAVSANNVPIKDPFFWTGPTEIGTRVRIGFVDNISKK